MLKNTRHVRLLNRLRVLPFAFALATVFAPAVAAQSQQPGLIGDDDRKPVTGTGQPWDAVGQVNIGGYRSIGQCTGTLVRPDLVITAAHCVMDDTKAKPHPSHNIHFLAGVSGGKHLAHGKAKCLRFLKGYAYVPVRNANGVPLSALYQDVAAIVLTMPLELEPAAVADLRSRDPGASRVHAAYPSDRRYQLLAHVGCRLLRPNRPVPIWLNDCDTHPASSGGPVFVEENGGLRLAAVMVGAGRRNNTALPMTAWQELLDGRGCE
jgi:V8-like Glu-specific endopeptidase